MATAERSTLQRIGDVEQMVTSFRRHLRAENKATRGDRIQTRLAMHESGQ
jgi:hypothetical protein